MIDERNRTDSGGDADEQVSKVYRRLADERAPERLNQAILRQARKAVRPPYARSILWAKPVAWTAVVAICLAITLQVTRMPAPDGVPLALPGTLPARELIEAGDAAVPVPAKPSSRDEPLLPEETRTTDSATSKPVPASIDKPVAGKLGQPQTESATIEIQAAASAATERFSAQDRASGTMKESAHPDIAEFELQDADMPGRADNAARLQSDSNRQAAMSALAPRSAMREELAADCDEEARASPASWYACIVDLEAAGQVAAADRQRSLLAESFPDFEMP